MLDDRGQSLHSLIPLDEQPPQLVDGLVLLLCLLFTLVLFGRDRSICHHSRGCARLGWILQAGSCFGAGSGPCSCFEPNNRGSSGAWASAGGIGDGHWENWRRWCISIHHVWYLAIKNINSTCVQLKSACETLEQVSMSGIFSGTTKRNWKYRNTTDEDAN